MSNELNNAYIAESLENNPPNYGPLPCVINDVVIETNNDQPQALATYAANAAEEPSSTRYTMLINDKPLFLSQQQLLDLLINSVFVFYIDESEIAFYVQET